jgi:hypothetical protein
MTNKDLIKQYVDTGLQLPEYQISKLSNNFKGTYFRKRFIAVKQGSRLSDYEYILLPDKLKLEYIKMKISNGRALSDQEYSDAPDDLKQEYIKMKISNGRALSDQEYSDAPDDLKQEYISKLNPYWEKLTKKQFEETPDELKIKYLDKKKDIIDIKKWEPWLVGFYESLKFKKYLDEYRALDNDKDRLKYLYDLINKNNPGFITTINIYKDNNMPLQPEVIHHVVINSIKDKFLTNEFMRLYKKSK